MSEQRIDKAGPVVERRTETRPPADASQPDPPGAPTEIVECSHAWEIDRPNQQVSHGRCSKCGAEKDFLNYGEELRMPFGRRRRS
ncbi:MAG: hypothetical protein OXH13_09400 [Chloroflexi bacterium]|nr:hypothetical protein [Chloroflexota bacterium]MCY3697688.1 hypothetical protein [Chloroflexota bacterium]MXX81262.1 hypothetical protein [Chloroflexota bacterium]MYB21880.1 hypothetical protein [Chloroflexota bacterium]MYI04927.1 hypothetical protein [Chloroflexota bacterium]